MHAASPSSLLRRVAVAVSSISKLTRVDLEVPFKRHGRFVLPFEGREGFLNKMSNAGCKNDHDIFVK